VHAASVIAEGLLSFGSPVLLGFGTSAPSSYQSFGMNTEMSWSLRPGW